MQFKSLFITLLCGVAIASPVEKRDAKPLIDALGTISTAVKGLTASVIGFTGDGANGAKILTEAEALLEVLKKATSSVTPIAALPLAEAVQVLQPGNALITDVSKVVDAIIAKKPDFDKVSLSGVVNEVLGKFKVGADSLIVAIKTKLPANVATVGDSIGKQINASLDRALAAYKGA
jgi:hypothetical protein